MGIGLPMCLCSEKIRVTLLPAPVSAILATKKKPWISAQHPISDAEYISIDVRKTKKRLTALARAAPILVSVPLLWCPNLAIFLI